MESSDLSTRRWRLLFVVLEVYVLALTIAIQADLQFWTRRVFGTESTLMVGLGVAYLAAWLFLLVVSPFFLRSLRHVALAGWAIAFGLLLVAMLVPRLT